jgi:hypothetical protein
MLGGRAGTNAEIKSANKDGPSGSVKSVVHIYFEAKAEKVISF